MLIAARLDKKRREKAANERGKAISLKTLKRSLEGTPLKLKPLTEEHPPWGGMSDAEKG